jgi:type IX secretion system PorP/SprF family membrane protein
MKKNLKIFILFICILSFQFAKAQQDPIYSQYIFNGLSINPAYAGYKETVNFQMLYRNQWTGLINSPKTFEALADIPLNQNKMGLGLDFSNDQFGQQTNQRAYLSYAYRLKLNEDSKLSFGLGVGIIQNSISGNKFDPINPSDPLLNIGTNRVMKPDMKAGIFYASHHFFAGLSFSDLLSNSQTSNNSILYLNSTIHSYLSAGAIYPITEHIKIKPTFLLREDFKSPGAIDLNCFLIFNDKLWTGFSGRNGIQLGKSKALQTDLKSDNAIVFLVEYYINPSLRIGYSYDYATTTLQKVSSGSHEISLGFTLGRKTSSLLTPRFF